MEEGEDCGVLGVEGKRGRRPRIGMRESAEDRIVTELDERVLGAWPGIFEEPASKTALS